MAGISQMIDPAMIELQVQSLPPDRYKQHEIDYGVVYIPGANSYNALRNRYFNEEGFKQDEYKHNIQRREWVREAMLKGMDMEQALKYAEYKDNMINKGLWNQDEKPRKPLTPSSSVVSDAKILNNGDIELTFKGRKKYTFDGRGNPEKELMDLLNSPSVGSAINKYKPGSWGSLHKK